MAGGVAEGAGLALEEATVVDHGPEYPAASDSGRSALVPARRRPDHRLRTPRSFEEVRAMAETVAPFEDADAASELTEQEFVRALRMAALVGIPALFAVLALMTALAVGGKAGFYAGALWPAIVGGPFFAGFAYLTWEVSRHEAAHHHAGTRRAGRPAH